MSWCSQQSIGTSLEVILEEHSSVFLSTPHYSENFIAIAAFMGVPEKETRRKIFRGKKEQQFKGFIVT
jgi:hypothetical protein